MIELTEESFAAEVSKGTILVAFSAPWCQPCKTMAPALEAVDQSLIRVGKVDIEQSGSLATKYMVRTVPSFLIFRDGKAVSERSGAMTQAQLARWVRSELDG